MIFLNFKENLKTIRESKKITQKELSELINIPLGTIRNWEQGYTEPKKLELLEKLKNILNCTYDDLLK